VKGARRQSYRSYPVPAKSYCGDVPAQWLGSMTDLSPRKDRTWNLPGLMHCMFAGECSVGYVAGRRDSRVRHEVSSMSIFIVSVIAVVVLVVLFSAARKTSRSHSSADASASSAYGGIGYGDSDHGKAGADCSASDGGGSDCGGGD
jgi:hypothetical protein